MTHNIQEPIKLRRHNRVSNTSRGDGDISLWCAVIERALEDLMLHPDDPRNSLQWILSTRTTIGSFIWVCEQLNIDRHAIVEHNATRIRYLLHLRRG